jgi:hypothetical protein
MEVTLSASNSESSTEFEKEEIQRCKGTRKEHNPGVFNDPRPSQLYPDPIAGFPARFGPPIKQYASGGKAMFTARLLCYRLVCRTRTGLQHIQAAWWDKRYVQAAISLTSTRLVLLMRQLNVHDAAPFTLRKKVGTRPDEKAGDGRRGV